MPVATPRKTLERLIATVAAVAVVAALALAFLYFQRASQDARTTRFFVSLPETWILAQTSVQGGGAPNPLAVSPDGRRVAFLATSADGKYLLWVRSLDTLAAQALAGTDGAGRPFWSPDSRFLRFFAGGKLKKVEVSGGPPITLCDASNDRGGTWSQDAVIVFTGTYPGALQKVSASGGVPTAPTTLGQGEIAHVRPFFLPDGRHFLYRVYKSSSEVEGPIYLASVDSAERKLLLNSDSTNIVYTQGHLLFPRERTLMAQPFDARRLVLTGEAVPIAEQIQTQANPPSGVFSASGNGVLAYQTGTGAAGLQLTWFDRSGKQVSVLGDGAAYNDLALSPDGKRASVSIPDQAGKERDIWFYDLGSGLRTRFTFGPADTLTSIWSPDGSRIVFTSNQKGHFELYQKSSSGAGTEEVLLEDNLDKYPVSWSPDGRFILYASVGPNYSLFVLPLSGDRKPFPFLKTHFIVLSAQFSPDGRWWRTSQTNLVEPKFMLLPFRRLAGSGRSPLLAEVVLDGVATAVRSSILLPTTS